MNSNVQKMRLSSFNYFIFKQIQQERKDREHKELYPYHQLKEQRTTLMSLSKPTSEAADVPMSDEVENVFENKRDSNYPLGHDLQLDITMSSASTSVQLPTSDQQLQPPQPHSADQEAAELAKAVHDTIGQRPVDKLRSLNRYLNSHASELREIILSDEAKRKDFISKTLKFTCERLLKIDKHIENPEFSVQIFRFIRNVVVNFFSCPELMLRDESLSECVHSLLNLDAHLYTVALTQSDQIKRELTVGGNAALQQAFNQAKFYEAPSEEPEFGQEAVAAAEKGQDQVFVPTLDQLDVLSLEQKRLISEIPWRKSLKVGDRLDAIKGFTLNFNKVQHWAPATIVRMVSLSHATGAVGFASTLYNLDQPKEYENQFYVRFDGESRHNSELLIKRDSADIAPLGTYTSDFDWRFNQLTPGTLVDCLDTEGVWYRSTILDVRETQEESEFSSSQQQNDEEITTRKIKEVHVAYRYYDEVEGHKTDPVTKKMYVGWSNKYDTWLSVTSPQIQRLNSVSKAYRTAIKANMEYDDASVFDSGDIFTNTYPETKVWVTQRSNQFLGIPCIIDYFNEFGALGGFESIIKILQSGATQAENISIKHAFYLLDFLSKTMSIWQRQFAHHYIRRVRDVAEKLFNSPVVHTRFHRDSYTGALKAVANILRRYYPKSPSAQVLKQIDDNTGLFNQHLSLVSACALLRSHQLEQRVAGLREINEQLKSTRFGYSRKGLSDADILERLIRMNVLELIYGDSQVQLVQRGEEVLKFMIDQKAFNEVEIRMLWASMTTKGDENSKLEFYKILESIQIKLNNEQLSLLIDLFASEIQPERFMRQEIECVSKLTTYCQRSTTSFQKAAKLFWEIANQVRPYPKEIVDGAIDKLIAMLQHQERAVKIEFINLSYERLESHKSSLQCVRIMQRLLDGIPKDKVGTFVSGGEIATDLIEKYHLITILIFDLSAYIERANQDWEKGIINKDNIDSFEMIGLPFTHRSHIAGRLAFIRLLLNFSNQQIKKEELDQIWDILLTRSKSSTDQLFFFEWFKQILSEARISLDLIEDFFEHRITPRQETPVGFKDIRKAGFDCIQTMFLMINEHNDKILIAQLPSSAGNAASKLDFTVLAPPSTLTGIDVVWKILLDCDKKNEDLSGAVKDLITRLYYCLSEQITPSEIQAIQSEFCKAWLHQLELSTLNTALTDEDKKNFVKSATTMLKSFLSNSEKNGIGALNCHAALDRGTFLERIVLQNNINLSKGTPKFVELNVPSNMTVWQLKLIAASKFKGSPRKIDIKRQDPKNIAIDDLSNAKLLRELRIENYEVFQVNRKPAVSCARKPLITKKKELTPEAKVVFTRWFEMFSDQEGFMNPKECIEFIKFTTGTPNQIIHPVDERVRVFYTTYDSDFDGRITLEDFLEFYRLKAVEKPDVVWTNLVHARYGNDLRPLSEQHNADDPDVVSDFQSLPRCTLTLQQDFFAELVKILKHLPISAQDELWPLVSQLRTNPKTYSELLSQNSAEYLAKKTDNLPELLYSLQVIDSFMSDYQIKQPATMTIYYQEKLTEADQQMMSVDQEAAVVYPTIDEAYNNGSANNNQVSNDSARDVQASAPESGQAIPLPPAPPGGFNVPPPPQVPFVGPMPPQQQTFIQGGSFGSGTFVDQTKEQAKDQLKKINDLLVPLKDFAVVEPLSDQVFEDAEIGQLLSIDESQVVGLRQNWIANFVGSGGVTLLFRILSDMIEIAKIKPKADIIKAKIEKDCMNQVLKIIKVLLMCTFEAKLEKKVFVPPQIAVGNNSNNNINNDSASSSNQQEEVKQGEEKKENNAAKAEEAKSSYVKDQEKTCQTFGPLVELLKSDVGDIVLRELQVSKFQGMILNVVTLILSKRIQNVMFDEKNILNSALNIWIACLVHHRDLLLELYTPSQNSLEIQTAVPVIKSLVEDGLLSPGAGVRPLFREAFLFISENIHHQSDTHEPPHLFLLKFLLTEVKITEGKPKESKQFFQLLNDLLHKYFGAKKSGVLLETQLLNHKALLDDFIERLRNYQSSERKATDAGFSIFFDDNNLIGYLQIIDELIKNEPSLISSDEQQVLIFEIVNNCLFTFNLPPISGNITAATDVQAHERSSLNKCFNLNSRKSAFSLLQTLCDINPSQASDIIQSYLQQALQKVKKPKKGGFNPRSDGRSSGFCGLKNLGCICYMNSMIQQFFNIPSFRYSLLSANDQSPAKVVPFEGEQTDDNLLHQAVKLLGFLELSERQEYNPREFCFSYKDYSGQPTNVRIQQDAQEFMGVIFDRLEGMLRDTTQKYLVQNVFAGQMCAIKTCKGCGRIDETYDHFYHLTLQVSNQRNVYDGLKRLTTGEVIEGFRCDGCNQTVNIERKTVLQKLPNMLFLHLQRIVFDMDTFMNKKLNNRIEFPNVLNVKAFMKSEVLKQDRMQAAQAAQEGAGSEEAAAVKQEENSKEDEPDVVSPLRLENQRLSQQESQSKKEADGDESMEEELDEPQENFEYKLVGVVVHMGTADAGHYLSYINISRGEKDEESPEWLQTDKDKWLEFNDSTVKNYTFSNLEQDCFGGGADQANAFGVVENVDYTKNAYMLVYEKRRKAPLKIVIPKEVSSTIATANDLSVVCPAVNAEKAGGNFKVEHDSEKDETYALVNFNAIQKFVPHDIYKMVHEDNHTFLYEKQIFNAGFFEAVKALYETILKSKTEELQVHSQDELPIYSFMERLVFELVPQSSDNKVLPDLTKVYLRMLELNFNETEKLIAKRILKVGEDNKREFFDSLVQSLDANLRQFNAEILLHCVNQCFTVDRLDKVNEIMDIVFAMFPDELCKNWLKVYHVMWFIYQLARSGRKQLLFMIEKNVITKLIDFFLENESPMVTIAKGKKRQAMGSTYAQPPMENLILAISYIARSQPIIDLTPKGEVPPVSFYPKWSLFCLANFADPNNRPEPLPTLSEEDKFMLTQKAFLLKGTKSGYESIEFSRLIGHLCSENKEFSRMAAKKMLVGLNKASADEVGNYERVLLHMLQVIDPYRQQRIEWILGIPQGRIERPVMASSYQAQPPKLKMGVETMRYPSDEICTYVSTLFKSTGQNKESYLQLLYSQRNKWPKFVVEALLALLQTCQYDTSGMIFQYLYSMDPPTYLQARYLDWVKPFLVDQIDFCMRNSSIQSYQNDLQIALQTSQLFEALARAKPFSGELVRQSEDQEQKMQKKAAQQLSNAAATKADDRRVYQYDVEVDGGQSQNVIWHVESERVHSQQTLFEAQITVVAHEIIVKLGESFPDGKWNHVFPKDLFGYNLGPTSSSNGYHNMAADNSNWGKGEKKFGRGSNNYQPFRQSMSGVTVQRPGMGRGQLQSQLQAKHGASSHRATGNRRRVPGGTYRKKANNQNEEGQVVDPQEQEDDIEIEFENDDEIYEDVIDGTQTEVPEGSMDVDQHKSNDATFNNNDEQSVAAPQDNNPHEFEMKDETVPAAPQNNKTAEEFEFEDPQDQLQGDSNQFSSGGNNFLSAVPGAAAASVQSAHGNNNQQDADIQEINTMSNGSSVLDQQQQQPKAEEEESWKVDIADVLLFTVQNNSSETQKINFYFSYDQPMFNLDGPQSQNVFVMPNIRLPAGEIPFQVGPGQCRDCLVFTKLKPFEDWGSFKWHVTVGQGKKEDAIELGRNDGVPPSLLPEQPQGGPIPQHDVPMFVEESIRDNFISCQACTFDNELTAINCEVCGSKL